MSSLKHNFSYQFLAALTSLLFPLITFPYIAHTLGPAMLGKVNYVDFLAGLIISLTCLGIPLYGTREIAKARHDPALRQRLFGDLLKIHLMTALAGTAVFILFLYAHPRFYRENGLVALGAVYILSNVLSAEWYLQGMEAFRFTSIRSIALRLAGLAAIFLLLKSPRDYSVYYAIIAGTQLITVFINYLYIKPALHGKTHVSAGTKTHLPILMYFFIASTFISIYDYTDTVMLGWLAQDSNVGYYTAAMKLVKLSLVLIIAINTILFPRLSLFVAEQKTEQATSLISKSIRLILTIAIPAMALYILLAPQLIQLFAGNAFLPSVPVMRWLAPLPLIIALSNLFLLYYLARFTRSRQMLWLVALAMLFSLSLNYWLIPLWKEQGAAIASLCTETFIMVYLALLLKIRFPAKTLWQSVLAASFFLPVILMIQSFDLNSWQTLVLSLLGCGSVYLALQLWVFRNDMVRSMRDYAFGMLRAKNKD